MAQFALNGLIIVVMLIAFGIVIAGFVNMLRGGSGNVSQKLMRARVIAQFVAIVLLMAALFLFGGHSGSPS